MENNSNLKDAVEEKIAFGNFLLQSVGVYKHVEGIQKLEKKIKQELNFLKKVLKTENFKKEYLQCSNLTHFSALVDVLCSSHDCISVNKVFNFNDKRLIVDIVCDNGVSWVKVVARNPKSLSQICMGDASYGVRSIIDQAEEFIECSKLYPCFFKVPKVIFIFANGIENDLAKKLESIGVIVKGPRLQNLDETICDTVTCETKEHVNENVDIERINLDVSTMVAYVSSLTNGNCNFVFTVPVLSQQAEWERERPVKPVLDELFKNKKLFCCQTAQANFDSIVNTVGGPNERIRARELMKNVIVLPDDATVNTIEEQIQFSPSKILPLGGKIKQRSKIIFRFGDRIQAMTVTANDGFVRSAKQQGINFVVFVHESRALTEQKEVSATPVKL